MIQIPVDVDMPPYTTEQITERLAHVDGAPMGVHAALAKQCRARGHVPTGERILTADQPRDICFRCGRSYEATPG